MLIKNIYALEGVARLLLPVTFIFGEHNVKIPFYPIDRGYTNLV